MARRVLHFSAFISDVISVPHMICWHTFNLAFDLLLYPDTYNTYIRKIVPAVRLRRLARSRSPNYTSTYHEAATGLCTRCHSLLHQ